MIVSCALILVGSMWMSPCDVTRVNYSSCDPATQECPLGGYQRCEIHYKNAMQYAPTVTSYAQCENFAKRANGG